MAGGFAYKPEGVEGLRAEFVKLQNQIDALRKGLVGLGIQIDPNGNLIFDGSRGDLNITNGGSLNVDGNETVGGTLAVGGTLNVTGSTVIGGTLSLPAGIINNAALANPVATAQTYGISSGLTFTLTNSTKSATITVPSGFTQALVMAIATAGMSASVAGVVTARADIAGVQGDAISSTCPASGSMSTSAPFTQLVTGLGSSFTVVGNANTNGTAQSGTCSLRISAIAVFLR